jgi:hypothetical protein
MPPRPRITVALPLLALALVLAGGLLGGCGEQSRDRTLSKREYIERANDLQQDAAKVFRSVTGRTVATPKTATSQLKALDALIAGYEDLRPPRDWKDEHATMLQALRDMRRSMLVISRASPRNTKAITAQVAAYAKAQRDFEQAVQDVNSSR